MAGNIKGITIEIGGNTTPLQKALSDVNSKSKSLKTELKDVERLLKLDPTNTTLLAQKQELLAQSVQTTKEKLDRLKEAEAQVQEQAAKGEITQEQYRAYQREVESTEEELRYLEKQQSETTEQIERGGKTAKQAAKEAEDAKEKWQKFGEALKTVGEIAGKAIIALGSAATAAGAAIVKMSIDAAYNADDLNTLAKTTGLATDTLQRFQYASDIIDVSMDTLTGSLSKLTKQMASARDGSGAAADAFAALGVSVTDENGALRDNEEVFADVIRALGTIENETERDALAMAIFGKSAQELNPLIMGGVDALEELGAEAEEAGLILSQDMLDSLNTLSNAMDKAKATTSMLGNLFGTVFAEDIAGFVNDFTAGAQRLGKAFREGGVDALADEFGEVLTEMVNKIAEALPKIVEGGLTIVEKFADSILSNAGTITKTAVQIVTKLVEAIMKALPKVATAAGEIVGTLGETIGSELPTLIPVIVQGIVNFASAIVEQLPTILEAVIQLVEGLAVGIIDAIPIIVEALPEVISGIIDALIGMIPQIIECGITLLTALVENLPEIIEGIVEALPKIITAITDKLIEMIPQIISAGVKLLVSLVTNLPQIIAAVIKVIPQIISAIVQTVVGLHGQIAEAGRTLFGKLVERGSQIIEEIKSFVRNLVQSIVSTISGAFSDFFNVGYQIVQGVWNGLSSGWSWLTGQVSSLAQNLLQAAKNALGIASPSRKFRDEVGAMMAAGIGEGFDVETPKEFQRIKNRLNAEERKLAAAVTNNSTVNNTTTLGGIVININGSVENAAAAKQYGRDLASALASELRYKGVLQLA